MTRKTAVRLRFENAHGKFARRALRSDACSVHSNSNYPIDDRHRRPVVSLAVLTDVRPDWRPGALRLAALGL